MENHAFIGASLSNARVIISIMRVLVVELLCQVTMGWIPVLECLFLSARGCLRLHLVLPSIKWPCYSRTPALGPFDRYIGYPRAWLSEARAHAESRCEDKLDQVNRWQNPTHLWSLSWGKGLVRIAPGSSPF
jgi:hypothetical protein